jgi:myo-inositol-1(or 4)-monophosphatase
MDAFESAARQAAERAGSIICERWRQPRSIERKSSEIDLVTEVDRACEAAILEVLTAAFPDHAFIAEESGTRGHSEYAWVIDPLDGTTNFAHGYPQVSVSIALTHRGETILGLVFDPVREERFFARRGAGAFLGSEVLRVSATAELGDAMLATGFPYDRRRYAGFYLSYYEAFMLRAQGIRRAGSAALDLCWVAAGRVDGFWEWKLKAWDTAAAALIVEEAGGRVSDFGGGRFDPFGEQTLATNGRVHEQMLRVFAALPQSPV